MNDPTDAVTTRKARTLTRGVVVDAAVAMAASEGLDAVSMRGLGQRVGVEAMSLYNHVTNKDDLQRAMVDRVVEGFELPDPEQPWDAALRASLLHAHAVLADHPWVAQVLSRRPDLVGPALMAYVDGLLRTLRLARFSPTIGDHAYHALFEHLLGASLQASAFPFDEEESHRRATAALDGLDHEALPDLADHIRYHLDATPDPDDEGEFVFVLDLLLEGLRRRLPSGH